MTSEQLLDRIRELRDAGRTPKEIARALKMPPSAVAPLIRSVAASPWRTRQVPLELGRQIVYGAIRRRLGDGNYDFVHMTSG
jgi:DNA-binding transcriptional MerR regulator